MDRPGKRAWLITCLTLGACASQPAEQALPRGDVPSPSTAAALSPAQYVAQAASIDLLALQSSELALQRSSTPQVRQFAQSMRSLHEGSSAQLAFAGRRLNLPTRPTMLPVDAALFGELQRASAFDAAYVRQQKNLHRRATQLHGDFQLRGASPTLRTVATFVARRLREHQSAVDAL